ncbi:HypC/HybG/HupF family hydrogenase formation chaperone [Candidatus Lokiarchaeum ossiferum]|uniref:HypC/HybG/HupF family hydrogenase formation chaperone n=1 Tax=Candidatus Lokiarchaeum ossiferum TaxID=2951803 RepID=UPI00352EC663
MCLAIPARILSIEGNQALADFDGTQKKIIVALVPSITVGQYAIVHAGMAIEIVDEKAAQETLTLWREMLEKNLVDKADYV